MADWQLDLSAREAALADGEARLELAELAVAQADQAMMTAERALDDTRRRSQMQNEELHAAELRHTELSGRRAAIRESEELKARKNAASKEIGALKGKGADTSEKQREVREMDERIAALHRRLPRLDSRDPARLSLPCGRRRATGVTFRYGITSPSA